MAAEHSFAASLSPRSYTQRFESKQPEMARHAPPFMPTKASLAGSANKSKTQNLASSEQQDSQTSHQEGLTCSFCGKWFLYPKDVKRHVRIHTGEKPFACTLCPYRAAQKGNVKQHMISVHKEVTIE